LLTIDIAEVNFTIHCNDMPVTDGPHNASYTPFISERINPDPASLAIHVIPEMNALPSSAGLTEIFNGRGAWSIFRKDEEYLLVLNPSLAGGPECVVRFSPQSEKFLVYCGKMNIVEAAGGKKIRNPFTFPIDQIILMYYLAIKGGAVIHAAGIEINQRGYVFAGRSGAGKTTISRQFAAKKYSGMMSDDRVIIKKTEGIFRVFGTPWPGEGGIASNTSAPLHGIFFLSHEETNRIKELKPQKALEKLLPVVSIPWFDREIMPFVLDFCGSLVLNIPSYELFFKPDTEVVDFFEKFISKQ
jgi:hypothetical protein